MTDFKRGDKIRGTMRFTGVVDEVNGFGSLNLREFALGHGDVDMFEANAEWFVQFVDPADCELDVPELQVGQVYEDGDGRYLIIRGEYGGVDYVDQDGCISDVEFFRAHPDAVLVYPERSDPTEEANGCD